MAETEPKLAQDHMEATKPLHLTSRSLNYRQHKPDYIWSIVSYFLQIPLTWLGKPLAHYSSLAPGVEAVNSRGNASSNLMSRFPVLQDSVVMSTSTGYLMSNLANQTHRNQVWLFPTEGRDHLDLAKATEPMSKSSAQAAFASAQTESP